jgi:hypothetical protein
MITACQWPSVPGAASKTDLELPSSKENSKIENTALSISEETKSLMQLNESVDDLLGKTALAQDPYLNPRTANDMPAVMFTHQLQPQISAFQDNQTTEGKLLTKHKSLINQLFKLLSQNEVTVVNKSYISEKYTPVFPVEAITGLNQSNQLPVRLLNINNQSGLIITHLGHKTSLNYLNFPIAERAQFIFDSIFAPRLQTLLQAWNTESIAFLGFVISYRVEAPKYTKDAVSDAATGMNPDLEKYQTETAMYILKRQDLQALVNKELTYQNFLEQLWVYAKSYQNQNLKIELD